MAENIKKFKLSYFIFIEIIKYFYFPRRATNMSTSVPFLPRPAKKESPDLVGPDRDPAVDPRESDFFPLPAKKV